MRCGPQHHLGFVASGAHYTPHEDHLSFLRVLGLPFQNPLSSTHPNICLETHALFYSRCTPDLTVISAPQVRSGLRHILTVRLCSVFSNSTAHLLKTWRTLSLNLPSPFSQIYYCYHFLCPISTQHLLGLLKPFCTLVSDHDSHPPPQKKKNKQTTFTMSNLHTYSSSPVPDFRNCKHY